MQTEFDFHYPSLNISIVGMNQRGFEIGNPSITSGRNIPWLQDVDSDGDGDSDVWLNSWDYEYRDVVIVDGDGIPEQVYNLTKHDLADADKFSSLKQMFVDVAATPPMTQWQSPIEPLDVDGNSVISPVDAIMVINQLGAYPNGDLTHAVDVEYVDVDGDGVVSPFDAIRVINQRNSNALATSAAMSMPTSAAAMLPVAAAALSVDESSSEQPSEMRPTDIVAVDSFDGVEVEASTDDRMPTLDINRILTRGLEQSQVDGHEEASHDHVFAALATELLAL